MSERRSDYRSDEQLVTEAYRKYLESRASALPAPPQPWRTLDSLIAQNEGSAPRRPWRWWLVPALGTAVCLAAAIGFLLRRPATEPALAASELLTRSATMELPANRPANSMVSLRVHGRSLVRPAVLLSASAEPDPELAHLAMLFAQARYSWREPLSARSFQSWRSSLREKRDSVTVIHAGGPETAYRVRTDTADGILRTAALTLRARDLHPTQGVFQFEGEELLEMEESAAPPSPPRKLRSARKAEPVPVETPASPADTLHVLAALNRIGADVGEPIEVAEGAAGQVLVRASGLSGDRFQQIAAVLRPLPHVKLVAGDAAPDSRIVARPPAPQPAAPERSSAGMPDPLRQRLEDRLGGTVALQEMTDRVLESSGLAVARAHAIEVLATQFPPQTEASLADRDRALLHRLRQSHVAALRDLAARLQSDLAPLLPPASATTGTSAPGLVVAAQQLDNSLNRLLAGSYSEPAGEALLHTLAGQLAQLRDAIALQSER